MPHDQWITIAQAARIAGRSPQSIYNWIAQGRLTIRFNDQGHRVVEARRVVEVEPTVMRGRPVGTPNPR